tara:strand:+ start:510 stop:761 length:252 start_codon:yes stop_codon:yes gene_type:complete
MLFKTISSAPVTRGFLFVGWWVDYNMQFIWKYRFFFAMALCVLLLYNDYGELSSPLFLITIVDLPRVWDGNSSKEEAISDEEE